MESSNAKRLLDRLPDWIRICEKKQRPLVTGFYTPADGQILEDRLKAIQTICYERTGGYPEAERRVFRLYPPVLAGDAMLKEPPVAVLQITWDPRYDVLTHRDLLGALMGLGIKREKIGDILLEPGSALLFADKLLADYIKQNLSQAGKASLSQREIPQDALQIPEAPVKTVHTTVSTPRLDSLAAACFGLSRSKAVPLIESGRVLVNWKPVLKGGVLLKEGDVISIRGMGRGRVASFGHRTKKDRLTVTLQRLL